MLRVRLSMVSRVGVVGGCAVFARHLMNAFTCTVRIGVRVSVRVRITVSVRVRFSIRVRVRVSDSVYARWCEN